MRCSVTETKTTLAADEILQCRCRAGESWPADCSEPWSSDCETPVAEPRVGPWHRARVDVGRS